MRNFNEDQKQEIRQMLFSATAKTEYIPTYIFRPEPDQGQTASKFLTSLGYQVSYSGMIGPYGHGAVTKTGIVLFWNGLVISESLIL